MSDGIEKAAEAFQNAIAPASKASAKADSAEPIERLFDDNEHEGGIGGDGNEYADEDAEGDFQDAGHDDGDYGEGDEDPREAEGDEDEEGEGDDDADVDDGDDEPGKGFDTQQFSVLVDGEEVVVTGREALEGYIRTQTFHRRLQKVHEAAQIVQRQAADVDSKQKRIDEMLAEAEEIMKAALPAQEPDWDKLYAEDPKYARELQKNWDSYKAQIAEVAAKRTKAQEVAAEEDRKAMAQYAAAEREKFVRMNPNWKAPSDMERDLSAMHRTAMQIGFTQEEINAVLDSRMLQVLLKASKYDRMVASKPKALLPKGKKQQTRHATTPPIRNSGKGSPSGNLPKGIRNAQQRLNRTGSVEDAADVFKGIIGR